MCRAPEAKCRRPSVLSSNRPGIRTSKRGQGDNFISLQSKAFGTIRSNWRWYSDAPEFTCWNGQIVRASLSPSNATIVRSSAGLTIPRSMGALLINFAANDNANLAGREEIVGSIGGGANRAPIRCCTDPGNWPCSLAATSSADTLMSNRTALAKANASRLQVRSVSYRSLHPLRGLAGAGKPAWRPFWHSAIAGPPAREAG
jgi:hypothetical protein